jgi:topoisomerase IV subunit A
MTYLEPLMRQNFLEYASYVVVDRAIPDVRDGCKPVQRRILHTLSEMDDGKFIKVANVIGETMKLHPHGDVSIGDALVVLANKGVAKNQETLGYFIERQGNFGNLLTGDGAAAARYIECRLTPLAKETLFNKALTRFMPSYDGRKEEPQQLPAKVPVVLMLGTEGIAVGMATTIFSHNFPELLRAQISILKNQPFKCLPDFPQGGLMDASDYEDGRGKIRLRAKLEVDGDKKIIIREIPFGTTTESLMESIEVAVQKGKVKLSEINDRTGSEVEIELELPRGTYAADVVPQLYAYTECQITLSSNITVIDGKRPRETTVSEILRGHTAHLTAVIKAELEHELAELTTKQHYLTLEQIFIENRVYKRIEEATTEVEVNTNVATGMKPFAARFVRPLTDEDIARLLEIRIKRISAYDISKNRKDIAEVIAQIEAAKKKLANLTATTIAWIESVLGKYEKMYPRRTKVGKFEDVDKKAVATANLTLRYDQASGFFGTAVKSGDRELKVTEYAKILAIFQDGTYQVLAPPEKTVLEGKLLHLDVFDEEKGFTFAMVYRDKEKTPWGKKVTIKSFIKGKTYELIKDGGKIDWFSTDLTGTITCQFVPAERMRITEAVVPVASLEEVTTNAARGQKLADKPTAKILFKK